jgi:bifunctional NMN adenylyltransferase/nudix hydrolase
MPDLLIPEVRPRVSTKPYDFAVLIGRFQPFHAGHLQVMLNALTFAEKLIILVGSSNLGRDTRNPFTCDERKTVIARQLAKTLGPEPDRPNFPGWYSIHALPDFVYDLQSWIATVQHTVKIATGSAIRPRIALTGHKRDATSFYLDHFPQWDYVPAEETLKIDATALRKKFFEGSVDFTDPWWGEVAPPETIEFLQKFRDKPDYVNLIEERRHELLYREQWGAKEPHNCADAVVIQSGHVLLVERGKYPGKGKKALPGGHLNPDETLFECSVRETREETCIFGVEGFSEISEAEFRRAYVGREVFDEVNRSRVGRVLTMAHVFHLPPGRLPKVKGADDAAKAFWQPVSDVRQDEMHDDHGFIIDRAIDIIKNKG